MKRNFILTGLLFLAFSSIALAYEKVYLTIPSSVYRPTYNPYSIRYQNPYQYKKYNYNNSQRIKRMQRRKLLNRLKRLNNYLTWNYNGKLTGYSVPINKDVYQQMGISPYDSQFKERPNSVTADTDLFSTPSGNENYYNDGTYYKNLRGSQGKTGVTIIYD